jgi:hypothetical protein
MDDHYIYVFVRQDLALADQLVHVAHAAFHLGLYRQIEGIPSLVVIGVPHQKSMSKVLRKLSENALPHYDWEDPDFKMGITAIAVGPLNPEQKSILKEYRLWSYSPGAGQPACLLTQDGGANAALAQEKERPVFNREVGSSILPCGSRFEA